MKTTTNLFHPSIEHYNLVRKGNWKTISEKYDIQLAQYRHEDGILELSFQESVSKKDWIINFLFPWKAVKKPKSPYKKMEKKWYAHGGFVTAYHEIRDYILEIAKREGKLRISGYSQGAAYATFAHEDCAYHGISVESIVYASPRILWFWGFWRVKDRLKNITIVNNRGDIVTHLPFRIFGFLNTGKVKKIGKWWHILPRIKRHLPSDYKEYLK